MLSGSFQCSPGCHKTASIPKSDSALPAPSVGTEKSWSQKVPLLLWMEATLVRCPSYLCVWSEAMLYLHGAQGTWDSTEEDNGVRTNRPKAGSQTGRMHATSRRLGKS